MDEGVIEYDLVKLDELFSHRFFDLVVRRNDLVPEHLCDLYGVLFDIFFDEKKVKRAVLLGCEIRGGTCTSKIALHVITHPGEVVVPFDDVYGFSLRIDHLLRGSAVAREDQGVEVQVTIYRVLFDDSFDLRYVHLLVLRNPVRVHIYGLSVFVSQICTKIVWRHWCTGPYLACFP